MGWGAEFLAKLPHPDGTSVWQPPAVFVETADGREAVTFACRNYPLLTFALGRENGVDL